MRGWKDNRTGGWWETSRSRGILAIEKKDEYANA